MSGEAIAQALRLLWAHKLRSALTMFGIVWGTASVIFLVGWGEGTAKMIERGVQKTGKNMAQVWAGKVSEEFTPAVDRRYLWYTMDDVAALRGRAHVPELVGAETQEFLPVVSGPRSRSIDLRGMDLDAVRIRAVDVASGRSLSPADLKHRRRVALIGARARRELMGPGAEIGDSVRVDGKPFQVVGFLEEVGTQLSSDGAEIDEQMWVPISTYHENWPRPWTTDDVVTKIVYRLPDPSLIDESEVEVRAILASRLGVSHDDTEAVGIWSSLKFLAQMPLEETNATLFVLAVATLMIGGIGVLNMMLDAVHERRSEIGVRLAVGARRRDIVLQFFVETFTICMLGGLFGAALGVGACAALAQLQVPDVIPTPILRPGIVLLALGSLVAVGVVAGVVPAWRASRIDPALTLRME